MDIAQYRHHVVQRRADSAGGEQAELDGEQQDHHNAQSEAGYGGNEQRGDRKGRVKQGMFLDSGNHA